MDDDDHTTDLEYRVTVKLTVGRNIMDCLWDPRMPERLTDDEADAFHKASNEMLAVYVSITRITEALIDRDVWQGG